MKKRAYRDVSANGNAFVAVFLATESSFLLCLISLRILVFSSCEIIGTLSIDNETDDDDALQPRQTGPRVSFSAGCSFPDGRRLFLCEELFLVTVLSGHSNSSVICIL